MKNSAFTSFTKLKQNDCNHGVVLLPLLPIVGVSTIETYSVHSVESSLHGLTIRDDSPESIPNKMFVPIGSRNRFDSFDSISSSASSFSLRPRPSTLAIRGTSSSKKKGVIVHPQTAGRPVVEFSFGASDCDKIPDHLLVPMF